MGLLNTLARLRRRWFSQPATPIVEETTRRCLFESMEERRMLSATPIQLGAVYIEEDSGADHHGDTFQILYEGGAPGTQLKRLVIDGDHGPAGLGFGDMLFDTVKGGLGADEAYSFQIVSANGIDRVTATVTDGGTKLILDFEGFDAGEKLVFSIDVDEVQDYDPAETNLEIINQGIDPIASGVEFQGSKLTGTFVAPHYYDVSGSSEFRNVYDPLFAGTNLLVTSGNAQGLPADNTGGLRDRSTGTMLKLQQQPLPISIAGTVYLDSNVDLTQDAGESGLAGVKLSLFKKIGDAYVDTGLAATTDSQGNYLFSHALGLTPGTYQIRETQPQGLFSVGAVPGTVAGVGSGSTVAGNRDLLTEISIPLGGTDAIDYDFAEARPASIAGSVYVDRNNNGIRDAGERGISGATVQLVAVSTISPQQNVTVVTDTNGNYSITGLAPGSYRIVEVQPAGYFDGLDRAGTVRGTTVGQAVNPGDRIQNIQLNGGDAGINYDFGELEPGSIRGRVHFTDKDGNCFSDTEILAPIVGAVVRLRDASGNLIAETTTDSDGRYAFTNLRPGTYTIEEVTPAGLIDGGDHIGTINGVKVGQKTANDVLSNIVIGSGDDGIDYDFCEHLPATLAGFVYHDRNDNGVRESGEEAIGGVTVLLLDANGTQVASTVTSGNGAYQFTGLAKGTYRVVEVHPSGWLDGKDAAGTVGGVVTGSATNPGDAITGVSLRWGDQSINNNFGELQPGSIRGRVHFTDKDGNCFSDTEILAPIPGAIVRLKDASGNVIAQTVTDANGEYAFTGLRPGTYIIEEVTPAGLIDGGDHVGTINGVKVGQKTANDVLSNIVIGSGQNGIDYDFCEHLPSSLSGHVFHDRNDNGVREAGEEAIAGTTVLLFDAGGTQINSTTTDANGFYKFDGLAKGVYHVREVHPQGWLDGKDSAGTIDGVVSGAAVNPGDEIKNVSLLWGQTSVENNFGELLPGSIRGRVHFTDKDGNCFSDTEVLAPIVGAVVRLRDASGNLIRETVTDANGEYAFTGLRPGTYIIEEVTPAGLIDGGDHIGTIGGVKVGQKTANDVLSNIVIGSDQHGVDYDFCEHLPSSIAGFVYHDRNNNGVRETGEEAIGGVTVALFDAGGTQVGTTVSDPNGFYRFGGLGKGVYRIVEVQPSGWRDGIDVAGTINGVTVGTAANPGDAISGVSLRWGDDSINNNFAEFKPGSISGTVHIDTIRNCLVDPGEAGIAGVKIELLDAAGNVIETTFTDDQGRYHFDNLNPGVYAVREVQPAGTFHAGQEPGSGGGEESRDLLFNIDVSSGEQLVDYNFCELPPATLSGYVFRDGPVIFTPDGRPPAEIQVIRDGKLTTDDVRLAGVILELRNALTGEVIRGEDTLPGTNAPGALRAVTDSSGFYQFHGLREGSYAVVQVQPEGYIDSLDTPGSNGGIAVNPGASLDPQILSGLETAGAKVNNDAIVRIPLSYGQNATFNNFSEIQIRTGAFPPELPPDSPRPPLESPPFNIGTPPPDAITFTNFVQRPDYTPYTGRGDYTWHLSVVNNGQPRGNYRNAIVEGESILKQAKFLEQTKWRSEMLRAGKWNLPGRAVGLDPTDASDELTFGIAGAMPLMGDFNGDGLSELAVFIDGEWFIDANGNGQWDQDDLWAKLGNRGDRPVVGDWDGDGKDDIGIFGPRWHRDEIALRNEPGLPDAENARLPGAGSDHPDSEVAQSARRIAKNVPPHVHQTTSGLRQLQHTQRGARRWDYIDHVFDLGIGSDEPIVGDFNGDGIDTIGVFNNGVWRIDVNGDGRIATSERTILFGQRDDKPVVGDFDGDGLDEIGIFRNGKWIIDSNHNGEIDAADKVFELGGEGDVPVVGDSNGDGIDEPGVYQANGAAPEARLSLKPSR